MKNRREFLKEMAAGAAILGAESKFALAAVKSSTRAIGKSKVVIVRDDKLRTPGPGPDPTRVAAMLDHAMQTYAGSRNPVDPWRRIVQPAGGGTESEHHCREGLSTNITLVEAICARLQQAGFEPGTSSCGTERITNCSGRDTQFRPTGRRKVLWQRQRWI